MTPDDLSLLETFFANNFFEDFDLLGTPDEIVQDHVARTSRDERLRLAGLIDRFVAERPTDAELDRDLYRVLGCYFRPEGRGMTTKQWLEHVTSLLRARPRFLT